MDRRSLPQLPINARDFAAHRSNVRAQLSAMVNDIEQRNPIKSTYRQQRGYQFLVRDVDAQFSNEVRSNFVSSISSVGKHWLAVSIAFLAHFLGCSG
jgi:hypothetical protein